eukprot:5915988-Pleurochrysis_carterae.AAC.1
MERAASRKPNAELLPSLSTLISGLHSVPPVSSRARVHIRAQRCVEQTCELHRVCLFHARPCSRARARRACACAACVRVRGVRARVRRACACEASVRVRGVRARVRRACACAACVRVRGVRARVRRAC